MAAVVAGSVALPAIGHRKVSGPAVVNVIAGKPTEYAFTLSKSSPLPTSVLFKVTNRGALAHSFKTCTASIESAAVNSCSGKATKSIAPGASASLTVSFRQTGVYEYLSSLPGDAAKGMKGLIGIGVKLRRGLLAK